MTLLITGSRTIEANEKNYKTLTEAVDTAHALLVTENEDYPDYWTQIAHGGAKGADQLAKRLAKGYEIPELEIKPDYKNHYAKAAPLIRNTKLVAAADIVIAMYATEKKSGGTYDTVIKAQAAGLPTLEIAHDGTHTWTPAPVKQLALQL